MTPKPAAAAADLHTCDAAVSLAFSILGKRWNGMLLATLGTGPLSFAGLRRGVPGISDAMLSDRLTELAHCELVTRTVDAGPPLAVSYALTEKGELLLPLLEQLGQWASANLSPATPARTKTSTAKTHTTKTPASKTSTAKTSQIEN